MAKKSLVLRVCCLDKFCDVTYPDEIPPSPKMARTEEGQEKTTNTKKTTKATKDNTYQSVGDA